MRHGALGVASGFVPRGGQLGDAIFQRQIAHVDDAILDRVVKPLELHFRLGHTMFKIGDMIHQSFEPYRVEQRILEMMMDHRLIWTVHQNGNV